MGFIKKIRDVGLWLASLKGFVWVMGISPTFLVFFAALFEGFSWAQIISFVTVTGAGTLGLVYYGLGLLERLSSYITSSEERRRITSMLNDCLKAGADYVDTGTAAAIWANTREDSDVLRHLRFRQIKAAISRGEIKNTEQRGGNPAGGPNIYTWIPVAELKKYFASRRIADDD